MGCCISKKPSSVPPSSGTTCDVKSPDPVKPDVNKPTKPVTELPVKPVIELQETVEEAKPIKPEKVEKEEEDDVLHRRSHDRSKKTDSEEASASVAVEKPVVRTSSCTKEEVDAILIQCGKLSRSDDSAAKTRRYSGSKRSFDFDQNERNRDGGGGGYVEEGRKTPQRNRVERVNGSPRERRRRTPSRERERERGGSRGVSRSPAKRSEATNPSPRGSLVNSSNTKFVRGSLVSNTKFVTVPARDKNGDPSLSKRVTTSVVKRSIGEACRTAAATSNPHPREQSQSPYRRRKPLGEIDQNATKGDKKKRENESAKPQGINRSRSLRKSRDFETLLLPSSEQEEEKSSYTALLLKDIKNFHVGKSSSHEDEEDPLSLLPSCVTKACSIVDAVAHLNSTSDSNQFRFTSSTVVKKADLMEPSFEKYVTVKRGCCSLEEQESSCASNNLT